MQGTTEGIEKLGAGETVKGIEFLGVRWIGLNPTNGQKLLATIALIVIMLLLAAFLPASSATFFSQLPPRTLTA